MIKKIKITKNLIELFLLWRSKMAVDFKKTLKHLYAPKIKPSIVYIERTNYIAVRGSGDSNDENSEYKELNQKS